MLRGIASIAVTPSNLQFLAPSHCQEILAGSNCLNAIRLVFDLRGGEQVTHKQTFSPPCDCSRWAESSFARTGLELDHKEYATQPRMVPPSSRSLQTTSLPDASAAKCSCSQLDMTDMIALLLHIEAAGP